MKTHILNYSAWWKVESSLNKEIPGEQDLPDFECVQNSAEDDIRGLLALRGVEHEDWDVPEHYHQCAVIYSYIYNPYMLNENLFADIHAIIPKGYYPWYSQLECHSDEGQPLGCIIIYNNEIYLNAEDPIIEYLSDSLGISHSYAIFRKLMSKVVCLPDHVKMHYTLKRALKKN